MLRQAEAEKAELSRKVADLETALLASKQQEEMIKQLQSQLARQQVAEAEKDQQKKLEIQQQLERER